MESILKLEGITKTFNKREAVLHGITMDIENESFTAVLGPSGSGKTTLINIISGLLKPSSGKVWFEGADMVQWSEGRLADWKRKWVGHIFQNYLLLTHLTVEENIRIGLERGGQALCFDRLTNLLEIENILNKFPHELSGGQKQRVAIARAVIKKPKILFCDEATGALDEGNSKTVMALLHHIKSIFGISIIFITHNYEIAKTANRVVTIKDGRVFKDEINENPILPSEMVWG